MSKDNVKRFFEELDKNSALNEKFISSMGDKMSQAAIISFAASNGFSFSDDELKDYCTELSDNMNSNHALDDESLAQAAGGISKLSTVGISLLSLGTGCALVSILGEVLKRGGCAEFLSTNNGSQCN